jgi:hypothetical protein
MSGSKNRKHDFFLTLQVVYNAPHQQWKPEYSFQEKLFLLLQRTMEQLSVRNV